MVTKASEFVLAMIGGGPRTISILSALSQQIGAMSECPKRELEGVRILIIDSNHPSVGAVWDEKSPSGFRCNAFSEDVVVPGSNGHFESLIPLTLQGGRDAEVMAVCKGNSSVDELPRNIIGRSLRTVRDRILKDLNKTIAIEIIAERVLSASQVDDHWLIETDKTRRSVMGILDSTGTGFQGYPIFRGGDSGTLQDIGPEDDVKVYGLGLGAIDVINALTIDRGGEYRGGYTGIKYKPSGFEPRITLSSRSGRIRRPSLPPDKQWDIFSIPRQIRIAFLGSTNISCAEQIVEKTCELPRRGSEGAVTAENANGPLKQLAEMLALNRSEAAKIQSRVVRVIEAFASQCSPLTATHITALSRVASKYTSGPPHERYLEWQALFEAKVLRFGEDAEYEARDVNDLNSWTIRAFVEPCGLSYTSPLGPAGSLTVAKTDPQTRLVDGFDSWWVCSHGGDHPLRGDLPRRPVAQQWQLPAELIAADIANFFGRRADRRLIRTEEVVHQTKDIAASEEALNW